MIEIKKFPTLYSRNSNNKITEWNIKVVEDDGVFKIIKHSGLLGTSYSNVENSYVVSEGKNIGRSNETSVKEQAISEALAAHSHKILRERYQEYNPSWAILDTPGSTITEILENHIFSTTDNNNIVAPMKCQPFWIFSNKLQKDIPRINFPCIGQPKINGVRALIYYENGQVKIKSKNGLQYRFPHIQDAYKTIYDSGIVNKSVVFDGELYIHNTILSKISGIARKSIKNIHPDSKQMTHYVFDICSDLQQAQRLEILESLAENRSVNMAIHFVISIKVKDVAHALELTEQYIANGYEGGIFRDSRAYYAAGKRPKTIVKLKKRISQEFTIIDVVPMGKTPTLGMFVCKNDTNEETFTVVAEGDVSQREQYLIDRDVLIGKQLTVEFYERTKTDKPFHAVGISVRDYE